MALRLSDFNDLCGLLMYRQPTPGYSFIYRNIPLYVAPPNPIDPAHAGSIPDASWDAFNYVVASREAASSFPPRNRMQACLDKSGPLDLCVLKRAGGCAPTPLLTPILEQKDFGHVTDAMRRGVLIPSMIGGSASVRGVNLDLARIQRLLRKTLPKVRLTQHRTQSVLRARDRAEQARKEPFLPRRYVESTLLCVFEPCVIVAPLAANLR